MNVEPDPRVATYVQTRASTYKRWAENARTSAAVCAARGDQDTYHVELGRARYFDRLAALAETGRVRT